MLSETIMKYLEDDVCDIRGFDRSELVSAEKGHFVMRVVPGEDCANNVGTVHGGFLLAVADIAASGACDTFGRECSSINFNANFMRPCFASDKYLTVTGTVVKCGRTIAVVEVEITRPDGKVAFMGTSTLAVLDEPITEEKLSQNSRSQSR